jgi:hypothetical protein
MFEESVLHGTDAEVVFQFLVDVDEARRRPDPIWNGKAQAVGLAGPMLGVLADNDDANLIERRQVERSKPVGARRENALPRVALSPQELLQLGHVRLVEFGLQGLEPTRVKFHAHPLVIASAEGAWQSSN